MSFLRATSVGLVLVSGCGVLEDEGVVRQQGGTQCPIWMCGSNSPLIDNLGFHDLHLRGERNADGFYLSEATNGGVPVELRVLGGQVSVTDTAGNWMPTIGTELVVLNDNTGNKYVVSFLGVNETEMWAQPGYVLQSHTYEIYWQSLDTPQDLRNVCSNPPQLNDPDLLGMNPIHAVVFEGDRIDAATKVVSAAEEDWMNIGCAGHALAKLHLTGHTEGARNLTGDLDTTPDQRTAMLKMFAGDYCGTGKPFTVAGQLLDWEDEYGWMKYPNPPTDIEARWSSTGATCLEKPRVHAHPTTASDDAFPDLMADIEAECGGQLPPSCLDPDPTNMDGAHVVSANP